MLYYSTRALSFLYTKYKKKILTPEEEPGKTCSQRSFFAWRRRRRRRRRGGRRYVRGERGGRSG
jgi:hypothetical protein